MRKTLLVLIGVAFVFCAPLRADDLNPQKIIDKAIEAHGGAEVLAKNKDKATIVKGKATINLMGGIESTLESFIGDDKFKHVMDLTIMGMNFNQIVGYDGKEMWITL